MQLNEERYSRQILFSEIGREGQEKLLGSRVVLVGCGADGSTIAERLVRSGVGSLTIVDPDVVGLSNLQRQSLFDEEDWRESRHKAQAAERLLRRINGEVEVRGVVDGLTPENAARYFSGADMVMDGTDNFPTRYLINDTCVKLGIPWVYCGVVAGYGMSMTVIPHETACFRCVFREPPPPEAAVTCNDIGIIAPIVTVMAGIAAAEGIKLLVGSGIPNRGIIHVDLWEGHYEKFESGGPDPECPTCALGRYDYLEGGMFRYPQHCPGEHGAS